MSKKDLSICSSWYDAASFLKKLSPLAGLYALRIVPQLLLLRLLQYELQVRELPFRSAHPDPGHSYLTLFYVISGSVMSRSESCPLTLVTIIMIIMAPKHKHTVTVCLKERSQHLLKPHPV